MSGLEVFACLVLFAMGVAAFLGMCYWIHVTAEHGRKIERTSDTLFDTRKTVSENYWVLSNRVTELEKKK